MKKSFALLLISLSGVQAIPAAMAAANYQYIAETTAPAQRQGMVFVSGINWNCQGARCTTSGPWATPAASDCHALAQQVGPVRSYGHKGGMLTPGDLQQCNAGLATGQPSPFARGAQPISPPGTPAPGAFARGAQPITPPPVTPPLGTPPPAPGTPPSAGPGLKPLINADTFMRAPQMVAPPQAPPTKAPGKPPSVASAQGPVVINANTLRYAGRGPVVINAETLRYAGRGPVVINADTLRYAGHGPAATNKLTKLSRAANSGPIVIQADTLRYAGRGAVVINAETLRYLGRGPAVINANTLRYSGTDR